MKTIIIPKNIPLSMAVRYMKRLNDRGYDCWFKTIANKDTGRSEVHIIVEERYITIINQKGGNK